MHDSTNRRSSPDTTPSHSTARSITSRHRLRVALIGATGCLSFACTRVAFADTLDAAERESVLIDWSADAVSAPHRAVRRARLGAAEGRRGLGTSAEHLTPDAPEHMREPRHVEVVSGAEFREDDFEPMSVVAPTTLADGASHASASRIAQAPAREAPGSVFSSIAASFASAISAPASMSLRTLLAHPGVAWTFAEITDASDGRGAMVAAHALRTHSAASITLDLDTLAGVHGLTLFAQYKSLAGRNGSGEAGLMQNVSNIDADDFHAFGEVWLEQRLLADRLRVKAGRLDFNTEFAGTENGANFLNASMGFSPSITAAPTFPLPSYGANAVVTPREQTEFSLGVFDGRDGAAAPNGGQSLFQIAQMRQQWAVGAAKLPGKLGLGAWRHTGMFAGVTDADGDAPSVAGTHGWYATIDQTLWLGAATPHADDARRSVAAYAQFGRSDPRVQSIQAHEGAGVTLSGFVASRASDVIGLGMTRAGWIGGREFIGEAFYQLPVTSHLSFVADMQHVSRRESLTEQRRGLVTTLRTIVSF